MANYRQIHTQIWRDDWFSELPANEKLLFIYLFSNDSSSLTGLYKLSLRVMAFETGLETEFIKDTLGRFETEKRVVYRDGIVWVVNMWRYHSNASPKVRTRIENDIKLIPDVPIKRAYLHHQNTGLFDDNTISILYGYPIALTNLNLTNLNSDKIKESEISENDTVSSTSNFLSLTPVEAVNLFQEVTGMPVMPNTTRTENDINIILDLIKRKGREDARHIMARWWEWWKAGKTQKGKPYSRTNTAWLDRVMSEDAPNGVYNDQVGIEQDSDGSIRIAI